MIVSLIFDCKAYLMHAVLTELKALVITRIVIPTVQLRVKRDLEQVGCGTVVGFSIIYGCSAILVFFHLSNVAGRPRFRAGTSAIAAMMFGLFPFIHVLCIIL